MKGKYQLVNYDKMVCNLNIDSRMITKYESDEENAEKIPV